MALVLIPLYYEGYERFFKDEDGIVSQITKQVFDELAEQGAPIVDDFLKDLGTLGAQTLEVIEGAGIAVLKASEKTWFYISDQIADRRVPAVAVGWAMLVYAITAATIYNRIKKA